MHKIDILQQNSFFLLQTNSIVFIMLYYKYKVAAAGLGLVSWLALQAIRWYYFMKTIYRKQIMLKCYTALYI